MTKWSGVKRFYEKTNVGEKADGEYLIFLDKRTVRTPAGADLSVPTRSLAEAMAAEWDSQGDIIDLGKI